MYAFNGAKLKELVADLDETDRCLILRTKNTGACTNVWGTSVTSTLLAATEFRGFNAHVMMLPPLTFRANVTSAPHPLMYVTDLAAAKETSSLHVTKKC